MHALFFEMRPRPGHLEHYFAHVARLRPALERQRGLVFLDRYASLSEPDLLLSHQLWESEAAIAAWRRDAEHRRSQRAGYDVHFADYRIRVGRRILHRSPATDAPARLGDAAATAPCVLALYGIQAQVAPPFSAFESYNRAGRHVSLANFDGLAAAEDAVARLGDLPGIDEIAAYAIHRDYGRFDRAQAPRQSVTEKD